MCGIAGVFKSSSSSILITQSTIEKIDLALSTRGPDHFGTYFFDEITREESFIKRLKNPTLSLFHRRLSIIDQSSHSNQPFIDKNSGLVLVFNGEIYNYKNLQSELKSLGCVFRTDSDTEVVIKAYEIWGARCFQKFEGMFALAIYDKKAKQLCLARDYFGIKPLYFTRQKGVFAFGSNHRSLMAIEGMSFSFNTTSADFYLSSGITDIDENTFFQEIKSFPQGAYALIDFDEVMNFAKIENFYENTEKSSIKNFKDAKEIVCATVQSSIKKHLGSAEKKGLLLSGGIDSSIIAASAYDQGVPLESFTYVDSNKQISEGSRSLSISRLFSARHHPVPFNKAFYIDFLDKIIIHQEEPFNSPSIIAQANILQEASKKGIRVMLSGQGADEMFLGYDSVLSSYVGIFNSKENYASSFLLQLSGCLSGKLSLNLNQIKFKKPRGKKLLSNSGSGFVRQIIKTTLSDDPKEIFIAPYDTHKDLQSYLFKHSLRRLLRYEDRNSMLFSIENRVPYVDMSVYNVVQRLPSKFLVSSFGATKHVLKNAFMAKIPRDVFIGKKIGFEVNYAEAFSALRESFYEHLALSKSSWLSDVLNLNLLKDILEKNSFEHSQGKNLKELWRIFMFIRWAQVNKICL